MKVRLAIQLYVLDLERRALDRKGLKLHEKYLYLDEVAKDDILTPNVLFALVERNDTTGVYIAEEHVLLAKHFGWTPIKAVLGTHARTNNGILEYYVPQHITEVEKLLEEEFK